MIPIYDVMSHTESIMMFIVSFPDPQAVHNTTLYKGADAIRFLVQHDQRMMETTLLL